MDIKEQIFQEYLRQGGGIRKLAEKYGISRTTICKWMIIHQGIHNLPLTEKQRQHSLYSMTNNIKILSPDNISQQRNYSKRSRRWKISFSGKSCARKPSVQ